MPRQRSPLFVLFLTVFIDLIGFGILIPIQPLYAEHFHSSPVATAPEKRSRAMGLIGAAFGLGFTFGPLIGGVMSRISYSAPFFFSAGLAVINAALVYLILPESLPRERRVRPHEEATIIEVFRHGRGAMFGIFIATYFFLIVGFSIMTTLFAL